MEDVLLELVAGPATMFFEEKVTLGDLEKILGEWVGMAMKLFEAKSEEFYKLSGGFRRDDTFVGPVKELVAKYKVR